MPSTPTPTAATPPPWATTRSGPATRLRRSPPPTASRRAICTSATSTSSAATPTGSSWVRCWPPPGRSRPRRPLPPRRPPPGRRRPPRPPPAAPPPAAAPAPAAKATKATKAVARISNSAGNVKPRAQAAADAVVANVPGTAGITIGGTRASAVDPHGHPSGLALDYMVTRDAALGNAVVRYHLDHWNELGVEYIIWQQKILTSPTGSWKQMEIRGSATANHMDHVHVNYRAA